MIADAIAGRCDALLQEVNIEYDNKRKSGRLGAIRFAHLSFDDFIARFKAAEHSAEPASQFKFLPLYRRTWEEAEELFLAFGTPGTHTHGSIADLTEAHFGRSSDFRGRIH